MRYFAQLFFALDQTATPDTKVAILAQYFDQVTPEDQLWTIAILSQRRPKRVVNTTLLRTWATEVTDLPPWLFEETYQIVGDLAETIANILPGPTKSSSQSLTYWIQYIQALGSLEEGERKEKVMAAWEQLSPSERFLFNKFITGGFRMSIAQKLMVRALTQYTQIEENILALRLMGDWTPDTTSFQQLILEESLNEDLSKPYPFYLANALDKAPEELGDLVDWQAERKREGIRVQIIVRNQECFIWSKDEELITNKFPEFHPLAEYLPDGTVLDGQILPFKDGQFLPFPILQNRIGRKNLSKNLLQKAPVVLMIIDLLEFQGQDIRAQSTQERRQLLEKLLADHTTPDILLISDLVEVSSWDELDIERKNSRTYHSDGLILKHKSAPYQSGLSQGSWWKWKVDPFTIDAVLIYAQRGQGQGTSPYSDFTFAVWDGDQLVPFTKAFSGLTDLEVNQIAAWANKNTVERFGPVRSLKPHHVFEIAFEGIQKSSRHKSGLVLSATRISSWKKTKPKEEANTLVELQQLLEVYGNSQE